MLIAILILCVINFLMIVFVLPRIVFDIVSELILITLKSLSIQTINNKLDEDKLK